METLLTISDQDFLASDLTFPVHATPQRREAARAVLFDKDDQVYLLNVSNHGYHKLPGGGLDDNEDIIAALKRELLEEVGCTAEITAEIGSIIESRNRGQFHQISYCFLARQVGPQLPSALEEGELTDGMHEVKVENIDRAISLLEQDRPTNAEGKFIQKRDLTFLKAARQYQQK